MKDCSPTVDLSVAPGFCDQSNERLNFFNSVRKDLTSCKTFEEFQKRARYWQSEIDERFELPNNVLEGVYDKMPVDSSSVELIPRDVSNRLVPRSIIGDGNCLYRCGSFALWKSENYHCEVRVRTIIEMAVNEQFYLDDDSLAKGLRCSELVALQLASYYTQFLEDYRAQRITSTEVQRLFRYIIPHMVMKWYAKSLVLLHEFPSLCFHLQFSIIFQRVIPSWPVQRILNIEKLVILTM